VSKLVVSANSLEQLKKLCNKDISGIIIYLDKLSVNSSFYMTVDDVLKVNFNDKEVFLCLNKIMHNQDLDMLKNVLIKLKDYECKILFYDMAVYNLAKDLGIVNKLVIYQDHLNTSEYANKFYYDLGICGSYLSSDITGEELFNIRKNYPGIMMFTCYGYVPIFYSRRYLITNYLKYINHIKTNSRYTIKGDDGISYPIVEEEYGTTVYSPDVVNLINKLQELDEIDYLVLHSNMINEREFNEIIDKFIRKEHMDNCYLGFYNTKTIYRVKGE